MVRPGRGRDLLRIATDLSYNYLFGADAGYYHHGVGLQLFLGFNLTPRLHVGPAIRYASYPGKYFSKRPLRLVSFMAALSWKLPLNRYLALLFDGALGYSGFGVMSLFSKSGVALTFRASLEYAPIRHLSLCLGLSPMLVIGRLYAYKSTSIDASSSLGLFLGFRLTP